MRLSLRALLFAALLPLVLSGCSSSRSVAFFPGVHKISIRQGNVITQDKVDQLRPGMTKNQVRFVLGTPLVSDPFNLDEWDYVFSLKTPEGAETHQYLQITFEDGALVKIEGDYAPSSAAAPEDDFS
jgi:outer membrane protein assembly factor BamE